MTLDRALLALAFLPALAVLAVMNLVTHEAAPGFVTRVFSSPANFGMFMAVCGLPPLLHALYSVVRILRKVRRGIFGGRISLVLASILSAMAIVPAVLVYHASAAAILRNIDSWFDVELEGVFDEGLEVARRQIDVSLGDLEYRAEQIARELSAFDLEPGRLDDLAFRNELEGIEIVGQESLGAGQLAAGAEFAGDVQSLGRGSPIGRRVARRVHGGYILEVTVPLETRLGFSRTALRVSGQLPIWLERSVESLSRGKAELGRLLSLRRSLKTTFIWSLSVSVVVVLCVAVSLAAMVGETLSRPLSQLAVAHRAVARGDFGRRPDVRAKGELGVLISSFNRMAEQLAEARRAAESNQAQLEVANVRLEALLSNLAAGVVVLRADRTVSRVNPSATVLLGIPAERLLGRPFGEWGPDDGKDGGAIAALGRRIRDMEGDFTEEIPVGDRRLLVGVRALPESAGGGAAILIGDIAPQLAASEEQTWEKASQRFAHEIKNPLTPIRLAAERIEHKLAGKLGADDAGRLARYVRTIVGQVDAMDEMVESFRQMARPMREPMEPVDLNATVSAVAELYRYRGGSIVATLATGSPCVAGNAVLIRQMLINLVNNSIEAAPAGHEARIDIRTSRQDNHASVEVEDDCGGMPPGLLDRVFVTKVTTKPKGTGLGLTIVRRIAERMSGTVSAANTAKGLKTTIRIPLHNGEADVEQQA